MSSSTSSALSTTIFQKDLFKGKVVFVTGGGSGICYQQTLGMMRHGADSVILGRRKDNLISAAERLSKETGQKCLPIQTDVRNVEDLNKAAEETVKKFGKIDFVICGAAGNFLSTIDTLSANAFKTVVDIDLIGTYNTIKATLSHVRKSKGAYLAISATLHYKGLPFQAHASAAKAGVDALIRVLAVELGPEGVRANTLAPGPIADTPGYSRLSFKDGSNRNSQISIPSGRAGDNDDMINNCIFLFSPAAANITGAHIVSDGGQWHVSGFAQDYPANLKIKQPRVST